MTAPTEAIARLVAQVALWKGISDGKQLVIGQLEAELAEARKVIAPFAAAYISGGEGTFHLEDALNKARDAISHEHLRRASEFIRRVEGTARALNGASHDQG